MKEEIFKARLITRIKIPGFHARHINGYSTKANANETLGGVLRRVAPTTMIFECSNEAVRCEFISPILHASVSLLEGLILAPQFEVVGDETTGRVDARGNCVYHGR